MMYNHIDKAAYAERMAAVVEDRYQSTPRNCVRGNLILQQVAIVEVTSMQTLRAMLLIFAGLIGASLSIMCFIALLPLLPFIRYLAGGCLAFGAFYVIALGVIDLRRRWLYSSIVPLAEYGAYHARRLELLHPSLLALPSPVITEVSEDADLKRSQILDLRAKGLKLRQIEKALGIPYNQVQEICAKATNLVMEK